MKIIIARPQSWIDRSKSRTAKIWFYDVEALYNAIPEVCEELGVKYDVRHIVPHTKINEPNSIYLGHHTYGKIKNMWHIKKGYVPGYMYWDKTGYSGWSELANAKHYYVNNNSEVLNQTLIQMENYIEQNSSKIKQPEGAKIPTEKYVLVLGQRPHDTVAEHAYINTVELARLVTRAYKNTDISVYTKPHPMSLKTKFPGKNIQGSMHKLVAGAEAIYTVNSGSGFESLFHLKKVFVSGHCDYRWACETVHNYQDIVDSVNNYKVDTRQIIQFIDYCFSEYFVNCYDKESIKRKIQRCIDEYEV